MRIKKSSRKFLPSTKIKIILLSFFILAIIVYIHKLFMLKNIQILSSAKIDKNLILNLNKLKNKNILFLDTEDLKDQILSLDKGIKEVSIEKKYPSTLIIKLKFHTTLFSLKTKNGYLLLSPEGIITKRERNKPKKYIPILFYQDVDYFRYKRGDKLGFKEMLFSLKAGEYILKKLNQKIDAIDISDRDMILFKLGDKKIYLNSERESKKQFYELKEIAKNPIYQKVKVINLRFERPIIRFNNAE